MPVMLRRARPGGRPLKTLSRVQYARQVFLFLPILTSMALQHQVQVLYGCAGRPLAQIVQNGGQ